VAVVEINAKAAPPTMVRAAVETATVFLLSFMEIYILV
jgi:hypothetical protein